MSIAFLLEKYDLSTDDGFQKACSEIDKEEEEVNAALDSLLQRQCHLGGKLRSISRAFSSLQNLQGDAERLSEMITYTSDLGENVSAKVRKLDLARSRVAECQQRVHDLIDLQVCSEGVQDALKQEDYEKGAAHVSRFLSMDPSILEQTAAEVGGGGAVSKSCATLRSAADKLRTTITVKFNEAVKKDDEVAVERFFKIFPLLGLHDEGVDKYAEYLCTKFRTPALKLLRIAMECPEHDPRFTIAYADLFSKLLEQAASSVEGHLVFLAGGLVRGVRGLQREVDMHTGAALRELRRVRRLPKPADLEPHAADVLAAELALIHSRITLFFKFLRRKVAVDISTNVKPERQSIDEKEFEDMVMKSELNRISEDILGYYLVLERYYLEESVEKAIQLDCLVEGQLYSSMIDDVFFIVRKCIRRAGNTGSIDGACALVNEGGAALDSACAALRRALRAGPPAAYLPDHDTQNPLYLAQLNNSEVSIEFVETLSQSTLTEMTQVFPTMAPSERGKLESCLSGLSSVIVNLKNINEIGLQQLMASAVKPRLNPWIDAFTQYNFNLTEDEFGSYESEESFIQQLLGNLETLMSGYRETLTPANADALLNAIYIHCSQRWESLILKTIFNRLGGLVTERGVRRLGAWAGARGGRLAHAAALLAAERAGDATACAPPHGARLAPQEVRQVLARRCDLKLEDIKRLKL